jgi:hypothetical protein
VNNNNGFGIGWLDSLALPLQLFLIITAHNQRLHKTRYIPYWTTSVFSSTVTGFVLIYGSFAFSAAVARWLTLHSWTFNHDCILTELWVLLSIAAALDDDHLTNELVHDSSTTDSIKIKDAFRLPDYRQTVRLGVKPPEIYDQRYAWPFVKFKFRTYSILLNILLFALNTSPLSIQALQGRSCLS